MEHVTRRGFAQSLGALSASATAFQPGAAQAEVPARSRRIDVHHHILPPQYVAAVGGAAIGHPALNPGAPPWDVPRALAAMDGAGVTAAVVSVSAPGVLLNDMAATRKLARSCNLFAAQMVADHPGRFGMFASLPLPDLQASLAELDHAMDELDADGVVLMSNYGDRYLGEPQFSRVFDALNARKAVVLVHPTSAAAASESCPGIHPR